MTLLPPAEASREEAWVVCRDLVVAEGYTYAEAAEATGIPRSTVEKRASRDGWQQDRKHAMSYRATVGALKRALLDKAIAAAKSGDASGAAQATYAWKQAESAFPEHRYSKAGSKSSQVYLAALLELLDALVAYLGELDPGALRALQPHLQPFAARVEAQYAS